MARSKKKRLLCRLYVRWRAERGQESPPFETIRKSWASPQSTCQT